MGFSLATALRTSRADLIRAAIDFGGGPGLLKIYDGVKPATGGAVTNLLATLTFARPCGEAAGGALTFFPIAEDVSADLTGTATWCRITDSAGGFVLDGNVGVTGSGAFFEMNTVGIVAGGPVSAGTTRLITEGNA